MKNRLLQYPNWLQVRTDEQLCASKRMIAFIVSIRQNQNRALIIERGRKGIYHGVLSTSNLDYSKYIHERNITHNVKETKTTT